jgi:acetoin utilization deacetylase AcuC-like enzyme
MSAGAARAAATGPASERAQPRSTRAQPGSARERPANAQARPANAQARPASERAQPATARVAATRRRAPARMVVVRQRGERDGAVPWILDAQGCAMVAYDDGRRVAEIGEGLQRHAGVRVRTADAGEEEIERALRELHDAEYLDALAGVRDGEPVLMGELAEPGLEPDTPVCAGAVATAREGVASAIVAARCVAQGERFSYALCRPPGHHAGPGWLGGYCYLNNAVAAARTLHGAGAREVAIVDLDLHYPNGTAALVAPMRHTSLYSLHGSTGANLPWRRVRAHSEREHLVTFRSVPRPAFYLGELAQSLRTLQGSTDAIVLSLGYDTVGGDPHGAWNFTAPVFGEIGELVAAAGLPVCVVQEGGYALGALAQCSHAFASGLLEGSAR